MYLTVGLNNIFQARQLLFRSYHNDYTPKISMSYCFIINTRIVHTFKYIVYHSGISCSDFQVFYLNY